jgi:hypothetical protein
MNQQTNRHPWIRILQLAIGLTLVLAVAAPQVALACHKGKPHGPDRSCEEPPPPPPDGGGGTVTPTDTTQQWMGSGEISSAPRDCVTTGFSTNNGTVTIGCDMKDTSPDVAIQFSAGDIASSGREPYLCELLSGSTPLVFGDGTAGRVNRITGFEASSATEWNGSICLDDGSGNTTCEVWVRNTAYGYMCHSSELDSGGACPRERLIILEGVGTADAAPAPELNPFTVSPQPIDLNQMTFWIKALGKNRTDATCTINFGAASPPVVIFNTNPR